MRIALALICLAALRVTPALAEDVTIPCQAVVQYTDNSTIPVAVTYKVYTAAQGQPKTAVPGTFSACPIVRTNVGPGGWCWEVTATAQDADKLESVHSKEWCKVVLPASRTAKAPVLTP